MSIGKFVMTKGQSWSGLTLKNHTGMLFGKRPELITKLTTVLLQNSGMKNLDTTLNMFPTKKVSSDADEVSWKVVGSDERNIPLVEARWQGEIVDESTEGVGAARGKFEMVFSEKYFTKMHLIVGHRPDTYQIRIIDEPYPENGNYVYLCEVYGGQESLAGIPGDEFLSGMRFSVDGAPVEDELSIKGAGIAFTSPYLMKNSLTNIRMEHKVSGKLLDCKTNNVYYAGIETRDPNTNKVHTSVTWMQEIYWQFEKALSRIKARTIMFGKTNRDENGRFLNKGASDIEIKSGSGIREQMEVSNDRTYNRFSIRILEDMLSELCEGKLEWNERKFMLRTGERGAAQFHRAVMAEASGWAALPFDNTGTQSIQKTNSKFHSNAYVAGFQFTEWKAPNNIHIMLEVDPMYDDKVRNKVMHPAGGVAESYRYDILYIGSSAEPNIQKIEKEGVGEIRGYMGGIRNPFTGRIGGEMQTMEDSATMSVLCEGFGAVVLDSGRTASFRPSILGY